MQQKDQNMRDAEGKEETVVLKTSEFNTLIIPTFSFLEKPYIHLFIRPFLFSFSIHDLMPYSKHTDGWYV